MQEKFITLTGPSAIGKGFLKKHLKGVFNLYEPPVYTTRAKRKKEDYSDRIFKEEKEFLDAFSKDKFIFVNKIFGNYYGFAKKDFNNRKDKITEIYINNVEKFKNIYPFALMIAILPKDLKFLEYRLEKRKKETKEKNILARIEAADEEIKKILALKEYFNYIYWIDKNNENKICADIEKYIKRYYNNL